MLLRVSGFFFLLFTIVCSLFAQRVSIFHTTDIHGYAFPYRDPLTKEMIGSFASIVPILDKARQDKKDFLMLDVGDIFQGTLEDRATKGGIISSLMEDDSLSYDAMVLGNHDFDYGAVNTRDKLHKAGFTVLGTNLSAEGTDVLDYKKDSLIIERGGVRFGIFGLLSADTPKYLFPDLVKGISFHDEAEYIKKMPVYLRNEGADVVILMAHIGFFRTASDGSGTIRNMKPELLELIKNPESEKAHIDIILDGHMHDVLFQEIRRTAADRPTYYAMAGSYGQELGELEIDYDLSEKRIKSVDSRFHKLNTENYPMCQDFLARHRKDWIYSLKTNRREVAQVEFGFFLEYNLNSKFQQDIAGLSVAKSFYEYAAHKGIAVDLALVNHKGVRSHLFSQAGKITDEAIHKICPFENQLVYFTLSGRDLLELFSERGKELLFYGGVMEISAVDFNSAEEGVNPKSFVFMRSNGKKEALKKDRLYTIVSPSFLSQTAEFSLRDRRGETALLGGIDKDAMVWYLQKAAEDAKLKGKRLRAEHFIALSKESLNLK
jgi:5'-nucleotidase